MDSLQNTQESQISSPPASSLVSDSHITRGPAIYSSDVSLADHATSPPSSQSVAHDSLLGMASATSVAESNLRTHPARPATPHAADTLWQNHAVNDSSVQSRTRSESPVYGTKRMASGTVKPTTPAVPDAERFRGHSRNISMDSAASNISELSSQLKARLSYAMVKVQNGWENRSINEVESLASQLGSPTSTTSTPRLPRMPPQSPRDVMANMNRRSRDLSLALSQNRALTQDQQGVAFIPEPRAPSSSAPLPSTGGPSLAPAAIITSEPTHRRRRTSTINSYTPPALATSRFPNDVHSHSVPGSPHGAYRTATPTPQEQDAVDTLLFMSSPANSANYYKRHGHNAQPSPLRLEFAAPINRGKHHLNGIETVAPSGLLNGTSGSSDEGSAVQASPIHRGLDMNLERSAKRRSIAAAGQMQSHLDVERLLDEMADGQSSDEEVGAVLAPVAVDAQPIHVRM